MGQIPNARVPVLGQDGALTLPWRLWAQGLAGTGDSSAVEAQIAALAATVAGQAALITAAQTAATDASLSADDALVAALLSNTPTPQLSALIDAQIGSTQGDILYRDVSAWKALAPGTAGQVLTSNGSGANPSWAAGGGGGGALTLISEVVTSGSQASMTFSSISGTYRDLIIRTRGRGTNASSTVQVLAQFNSDSGANYDRIDYEIVTTGANNNINGTINGGTSTTIGYLAAASAAANECGGNEATIFDYRGTTFEKSYIYQSNVKFGITANDTYAIVGSGWWRSTAAITAIEVFLSSGSFVNGSVVSLYGSM